MPMTRLEFQQTRSALLTVAWSWFCATFADAVVKGVGLTCGYWIACIFREWLRVSP